MLAAESAWMILRAEHAQMRDLLASIDDVLRAREWWRAPSQQASLRALIQRLRAFDGATHRPKGNALRTALRGRSPQADDLLEQLELDHTQCERLLAQSLLLLDMVQAGDVHAAAECASVLERQGALMRSHLDREDTTLRQHSAQLLTPEEWCDVVSSISTVVQSLKPRPGHADVPTPFGSRTMQTFHEFDADARARGFNEVLERNWSPLTVLDDHTHPFALTALVVRGEMWLTVSGNTRHLKPGDTFELEREVPHAERYGSEGATYWVARRH